MLWKLPMNDSLGRPLRDSWRGILSWFVIAIVQLSNFAGYLERFERREGNVAVLPPARSRFCRSLRLYISGQVAAVNW